jgi:hypothetical protein
VRGDKTARSVRCAGLWTRARRRRWRAGHSLVSLCRGSRRGTARGTGIVEAWAEESVARSREQRAGHATARPPRAAALEIPRPGRDAPGTSIHRTPLLRPRDSRQEEEIEEINHCHPVTDRSRTPGYCFNGRPTLLLLLLHRSATAPAGRAAHLIHQVPFRSHPMRRRFVQILAGVYVCLI